MVENKLSGDELLLEIRAVGVFGDVRLVMELEGD